jgi:hypothetical protein
MVYQLVYGVEVDLEKERVLNSNWKDIIHFDSVLHLQALWH